jgi:putative endonuclease
MSYKRNVGNLGENLAAEYLRSKGYQILERNWLCRYGELDIVAQEDEKLVFCEVKSIHGENLEGAFANLTSQKVKKVLKAVHYYLAAKNLEEMLWRFDAIAVVMPSNADALIEHVEDALDW